ncbi:hypothetical protein D3C78_1552160 [compost metagenome]
MSGGVEDLEGVGLGIDDQHRGFAVAGLERVIAGCQRVGFFHRVGPVRNRQVFPAGRDTDFSRAGNYRRAWRCATRRLKWTGFVGDLSCSEDKAYTLSEVCVTKPLAVKMPTGLSVNHPRYHPESFLPPTFSRLAVIAG